MLIYKDEYHLKDAILASRSVAYTASVEKLDDKMVATAAEGFSKAAHISRDTPHSDDLYYTRSLYVTTNWNANSDVFLPGEVWAARYTPVDKQTNIEHDHSRVVGHIVSTWAVSQDGDVIDSEMPFDDVPEFFHLCNGGVIYTRWQDESMQANVDELIGRIEQGKQFVSMECLFPNFDYALRRDDDGDIRIIERNEKTSFLTAKLGIYGGEGEYNGEKIGRVLRNITFSGKGYVETPANPASVIFANDKVARFTFASKLSEANHLAEPNGVYKNDKEKTNMSDTNKEVELLKAQLDEMKAAVASADDTNKALKKELDEKQAKAHSEAVAKLESKVEDLEKELDGEKEAKACMCNQYEELKAKYDDLEKVHAEAVQKARAESRLNALKGKGLNEEEAKAKFEALSNLSDENFTIVLEMLTVAAPAPAEEKKEDFETEASKDEGQSEDNDKLAPEEGSAKASVKTSEVDSNEPTEDEKLMASVASLFDKQFKVKNEESK